MNLEELMALRNSPEAPFDHAEYTIWLHNKIVDKVNYDLWQLRENTGTEPSQYVICNKIMTFDSLKRIS